MTVRWLALGIAAVVVAGCQSGGSATSSKHRGGGLSVFAASSLTSVLPRIDDAPTYEFAGSDQVAAQLRAGAVADVIVSANTKIPEVLHAEGLVETPVVIAGNHIVMIVPKRNGAPESIDELRDLNLRVLMGDAGVPVGDYTRAVLTSLGTEFVLAGVDSYEHDARSIVGKVALGEADAGFVYATDVAAAKGHVTAIELPATDTNHARYAAAVVVTSKRSAEARRFVAMLTGTDAQQQLRAEGFSTP